MARPKRPVATSVHPLPPQLPSCAGCVPDVSRYTLPEVSSKRSHRSAPPEPVRQSVISAPATWVRLYGFDVAAVLTCSVPVCWTLSCALSTNDTDFGILVVSSSGVACVLSMPSAWRRSSSFLTVAV